MIAWWIAQLALLGALLALAALGAESALKVARRPTRFAWVAALLLTIVLGALAPARLTTSGAAARVWDSTSPATTIHSVRRSATLLATLSDKVNAAAVVFERATQRVWTAWHETMPANIDKWLLAVWAAASIGLLCAFVAVHVQYQRRRLHWPLGSVHGTTVRIADDTGPAVIGVTSAEIVLPHWLLARDNREQELVLAHEMEHVRAHDPILLALAQAAVVLMPWHPAVWWTAARLRLAIELDCDKRVLQRGASARDYGKLLIDLTDHRTGFGVALPAFSCSPSHLERRLIAMTPKRLRYPLLRALATGAMASLAVLAACEAKLPTSDEVDNMTALSATAVAGKMALIDTARVTYYVDGVPVSLAEAEKIDAEHIATVNVVQKGMQSGGEVRITTILSDSGFAKASGDSGPKRITYNRTDANTPSEGTGRVRVTLKAPDGSQTAYTGTGQLVNSGADFAIIRMDTTDKKLAEVRPRTNFSGLVIIDGAMSDMNAMSRLAPDQIASVNVIKGAAARQQYHDPRAVDGVIEITTKKAVKP